MATVQDVLDLIDYYLNDYDQPYYASYTGDSTSSFYEGKGPMTYQSETVTVNGVEKTRDTHYTIDYSTGNVTFTSGNIPGAVTVVVSGTKKRFPFDAKLAGIKAALCKYYYVTVNTSLTTTLNQMTLDVSGVAPKRIISVELADASGNFWGRPSTKWTAEPDQEDPTSVRFFDKPPARSVKMKITKGFCSSLTAPTDSLDANFPDEYSALEVLALKAAHVCAMGARSGRITNVNFPSVAAEFIAKPYDHQQQARDIFAQYMRAEGENLHLLKPPVKRNIRTVG